jgi:hypothetical protein
MRLDALTGARVPGFSAGMPGSAAYNRAIVHDVKLSGDSLYVAGANLASMPGPQALLKLDSGTGARDAQFQPSSQSLPYSAALAIAVSSDGVYVAGTAANASAPAVVKLHPDSGAGVPGFSAGVQAQYTEGRSLILENGSLWLGRGESLVPLPPASISQLNSQTGALVSGGFNSATVLGPYSAVNSLVASDGALLAAGAFMYHGGAKTPYLAKTVAGSGGLAPDFQKSAVNAPVERLARGESALFVAGEFAGSTAKTYLLKLAATTGERDPVFNNRVGLNGRVEALAYARRQAGDAVLIGGFSGFSSYDGEAVKNLLAVDASTGARQSWLGSVSWEESPASAQGIKSIQVLESKILVAGRFDRYGGQPAKSVARVSAVDGALDAAFGPNPAIASEIVHWAFQQGSDSTGGALYVHQHEEGMTLPYPLTHNLFQMTLPTGSLFPVSNVQPNKPFERVLGAGSALYIGGEFTQIAAQETAYLAKLTVPASNPAAGTLALDATFSSGAGRGFAYPEQYRIDSRGMQVEWPTEWQYGVTCNATPLAFVSNKLYVQSNCPSYGEKRNSGLIVLNSAGDRLSE